MTHLPLFLSSCPRFLIFVFLFLYTKDCPRRMARVSSNLHNSLARQVLPRSFYIGGNWGSRRFINFSKVTQQISGWRHFSMEPLTPSLISKISVYSFGLPMTNHILIVHHYFTWIPVEMEWVMSEGQSWEVLPRSWHERLKPETEGDRRAQGR